jgi:hypothetical protein
MELEVCYRIQFKRHAIVQAAARSTPCHRMTRLRFDAYGRMLEIERSEAGWDAFDVGYDGKRRRADAVLMPSALAEEDVARWLADLCHESATARHPTVRRL